MTPGDRPPAALSWRKNLAVLWAANFLTSAGLMAILPYFPQFLRELGETEPAAITVWSGWLVGIAPLFAAVLAGFWGSLGDRVGRRAMILRAMVAIVVCVGLMAFATRPWHLLVLRLLQGVFSGYVAPGMTLVSLLAPADRQGRVGGQLQTAVLAGSVAGPMFGGLLGPHAGFRTATLACAGMAAAAFLLVRLFADEIAPARESRPGGLGRALAQSFRALRSEVAAARRDRALARIFLALFAARLALAAPNPLITLFVENLMGETSDRAVRVGAWVYAAFPVAVLLAAPLSGRLSDRRGARLVLAISVASTSVALLCHALVTTPLALGAARFAAGICSSGVFPAAFALAAAGSSPDRRGGAMGLTFSALQLGLAVGPCLGAPIAAWLGPRALFACSAAVLIPTAFLAARPPSRTGTSVPPAPSAPITTP